MVDLALYVVNNFRRLRESGASIVLYLPKIQTAEEAALWNDMLNALERHVGLPPGTIKTYVLVEQIDPHLQRRAGVQPDARPSRERLSPTAPRSAAISPPSSRTAAPAPTRSRPRRYFLLRHRM